MPYPAQTDRATIVETARQLIESEGVENISLAQIATVLNIKAPSLYRHVPSKAALIGEVVRLTFERLFETYRVALQNLPDDPTTQIKAIWRAHRTFAHANPRAYVLAFTAVVADERADPYWLVQSVLPIQQIVAALVGTDHALTTLRAMLAFVHGFVMLELHQQFQRGGDLTEAYLEAIDALLAGWRGATRNA